jgi:hypothetical protein
MELNVYTQNLALVRKGFYFLKKFVYYKVNAILPFIKWITLIADYAEIWKAQKYIDLLEAIIAWMKVYFQLKESL